MKIKVLKILKDNPAITSPGGYVRKLDPITMEEIINLEEAYNKGNPFPIALRELLYLAGKSCYVLDHGHFYTQTEMQIGARSWMTKYGRNFHIDRPFFVIDVYNAGDQFLFVYTDEPEDDPMVYEALFDQSFVEREGYFTYSLERRLAEYLEFCIDRLKRGYNPF
jgi:hypothetical protein